MIIVALGLLFGVIMPYKLYTYVVKQIKAGEWGDVDLSMNKTAHEEPWWDAEDMPDMRDEDHFNTTARPATNEEEGSARVDEKEEL